MRKDHRQAIACLVGAQMRRAAYRPAQASAQAALDESKLPAECCYRVDAVVSTEAVRALAPDEGGVCGLRAAGICMAVAKRERDLALMPLARMRERR